MKRGYVFKNERGEYLTGGLFWSDSEKDSYLFTENEIEKSIMLNYMRWDWKPVFGLPALESNGEMLISPQQVPFYKFEDGTL